MEAEPRLDGRNMVMVLAPDKRAKQSAAARAPRDERSGGGSGQPKAAPATTEAVAPGPVAAGTETAGRQESAVTAEVVVEPVAEAGTGQIANGATGGHEEVSKGGTPVPVEEGT